MRVEGDPSPGALRRLREGVELDDGVTAAGAGLAGERGTAAHCDPRGAKSTGSSHVRRRRPRGHTARAHAHRSAPRRHALARLLSPTFAHRSASLDGGSWDDRRAGLYDACHEFGPTYADCAAPRPVPRTPPTRSTDVTQELLLAMLERNGIDHDDVISVFFTTTPDLTAAFPATAARGDRLR